MLINKERAYEIMDKYKLDGLVAVYPINVYYLTDFSGFNNKTQRNFYEFAVFPRDEKYPAAYITTSVELPRLLDNPSWVPNIISYSHPIHISNRDYDTLTEDSGEGIIFDWPKRNNGKIPEREKKWIDLKSNFGSKVAASPAIALKKAIIEAGLEKKNIGTDDPRIILWMNEMGLPRLKGLEATNIFREIRMIKSQPEIDLLTIAADINEKGMIAAINKVHKGSVWEDIESAFNLEITKLRGKSVYITAGPGGLPYENVVEGMPIMLDCLSAYNNYHGDLGRTVFVGEPSKEVLIRNKAMALGWEKAKEIIKPGLKGKDLTEQVIKVIEKEGFPGFIIVTPHSIGLEHTDHPLPIGTEMPGSKGDFVFQENMVVNIDMPYHEYNWGSMHLEDTLVITSDGSRAITSESTELIII